ncbi:zinc-ribbon domain containing protein [Chryseobacterium indologenes]|uniref:Probable zinc-binding domain-containing protein n=1 Tax=Chryseobacterium indologenes TaxID=253 RepID=A0A0N0ZVY0_CHRID|nr:zinc-ribbon domain containing protein [Chryseobacterium indologenes]KPE50496.1 hypothetical protein AOB46_13980 [Chryseobacterium indologenes]
MRKQKEKYVKCPCCSIEKPRTEITVCLSILGKIIVKHYEMSASDAYEMLIDSNYIWACDDCLNRKKAIVAFPTFQNNELDSYLAYYDTDVTCRTCGTKFTFTKEEKKLWYETLKFRMESMPVNCLPCRKQVRLLKAQNNTLSEILKKDAHEISIEELKTLVDIYTQWDKQEKATYYERLITKKLKSL